MKPGKTLLPSSKNIEGVLRQVGDFISSPSTFKKALQDINPELTHRVLYYDDNPETEKRFKKIAEYKFCGYPSVRIENDDDLKKPFPKDCHFLVDLR